MFEIIESNCHYDTRPSVSSEESGTDRRSFYVVTLEFLKILKDREGYSILKLVTLTHFVCCNSRLKNGI